MKSQIFHKRNRKECKKDVNCIKIFYIYIYSQFYGGLPRRLTLDKLRKATLAFENFDYDDCSG
jgi:hypothetical protein